jgi:hypothetical protein
LLKRMGTNAIIVMLSRRELRYNNLESGTSERSLVL